jgi:hypothetical protein
MILRLHEYFGVPEEELKKRGVLNGLLGIDNKLFVDPTRLTFAKTPEFEKGRGEIEAYFADVIRLLQLAKAPEDIAWKEASRRLEFRERQGVALGYSHAKDNGSGIGPDLAQRLATRGWEIVQLGITDPLIFELIGLFEEDFGPDRLSDMAIGILWVRFLSYTDRISKDLDLKPRATSTVGSKNFELPITPWGKPMILVPSELLDPLPVALDRSEIDQVAAFNEALRTVWNKLIFDASRRRISKADIRNIFLKNPTALADLIKVYREASRAGYDFDSDPTGLFSWWDAARNTATQNPVEIDPKKPKTVAEILHILDQIIRQFKKNVEENRLYETLYSDTGKPRNERYSQLLFFGTADAYCDANGIELSREANAGNGPVDFKLSGAGKVLVELKLSKNDLVHGYTVQLPAYMKSEGADDAVYVIIRVADPDLGIKSVLELENTGTKEGKKMPKVYVIDGRPRPSASKM